MSRPNNDGRSRSGSTSNQGSGSRRHGESSTSAGGSRTMTSQEDPDTQLDKHWAFVKPTESDEDESFAITLYYPERNRFSKKTNFKYQKTYFDAQTKTLIIEVNPN